MTTKSTLQDGTSVRLRTFKEWRKLSVGAWVTIAPVALLVVALFFLGDALRRWVADSADPFRMEMVWASVVVGALGLVAAAWWHFVAHVSMAAAYRDYLRRWLPRWCPKIDAEAVLNTAHALRRHELWAPRRDRGYDVAHTVLRCLQEPGGIKDRATLLVWDTYRSFRPCQPV
jgi:hypothetical protein